MKNLSALIVTAVVLLSGASANALEIDLSQSRIMSKDANSITLEDVYLGDLKTPIWARFKWDAQSNALNLDEI